MADKYLTFDEFVQIAISAIQTEFPQLNPNVKGHWGSVFSKSNSGAAVAVQSQVQDLERELFPQTATGKYLDWWGAYDQLTRHVPTKATGEVAQAGDPDTVILTGSKYYALSNDQTYLVTADSVIIEHSGTVLTITRDDPPPSTLYTVVTGNGHGLLVGSIVRFSGVVSTPPDFFNDIDLIVTQIIDSSTFQFVKSPGTVATGTGGTYFSSFAEVFLQAQKAGAIGNLSPQIELELLDPPVGITQDAVVVNGGITGGLDEEDNESFRSRIFQSRSALEGVFTVEQIRKAAKTIPGNTRVYIITPNDVDQPATSPDPLPGQVTIYIFRDDDSSPIPTPTILSSTKTAIIEYGKMPANTSADDIFVLAPTLLEVDFTFTSVSPSSSTMKDAVTESLKAFFQDSVDYGKSVPQNSYLAAIQNTQDPVTGEFLKTFSLSAPSGDIIVPDTEIAYLGTVIFP